MSPSVFRALLCSFLILFFICEDCQVDGRRGFGDTEQSWGYVTVRPHAHMFWWLYYTTAPVADYTQRPLIIWLQGGPGVPSSGYGVFAELGPLDINLKRREHSWVKGFNILFIDNPVGAGFSYFSRNNTYRARSIEDIGEDLMSFLKAFLKDHPRFQNVPTYIFGESYGGKMAVELAYQIAVRRRYNRVRCNLKGVGLGDSYVSPVDYIAHYGPLPYHLGLLDRNGFKDIEEKVIQLEELVNSEKYTEAAVLENVITSALGEYMGGVDLYNFMEKTNATALSSFWANEDKLNTLLNEKVKPALNLPEEVEWKFFADETYSSLKSDFLKSVTGRIESLLNNTDIEVIVYNGMLDILVNTAGTAKWLNNLKWRNSDKWLNATQKPFVINEVIEGYVTEVENLVFYVVSRAGHSVPIDNPGAMEYILSRVHKRKES